MNKTEDRLVWIDAGKALGIVLVVAAHNPFFQSSLRLFYEVIMAFHVPLFFALSGVLLGSEYGILKSFSRSISLIYVYLVSALISMPLVLLVHNSNGAGFLTVLTGIFYGTGYTMHPGPLWFLPCLALSIPSALFFLKSILKLNSLSESGRAAVVFVVSVALVVGGGGIWSFIAYDLKYRMEWGGLLSSGLIWSLDVLPVSVGFLLLGWVLSKMSLSFIWAKALVVGLAFIVVFLIFGDGISGVNERQMDPVDVVLAILGVSFCFFVLRSLTSVWGWVSVVGSATLPILVMHQFIQKKILVFVSGLYEGAGVVAFAISLVFAIAVPAFMDVYIFKRIRFGQMVFYPRKAFRGFFNKFQ